MNAVRHKDSAKAEWGERDVVPLSPAVRKANRRNKVVPRACPWGSTRAGAELKKDQCCNQGGGVRVKDRQQSLASLARFNKV